MFGWIVLAGFMMFAGACCGMVGWISWWCCNDLLCIIMLIVSFLLMGGGATLWEEIKENF